MLTSVSPIRATNYSYINVFNRKRKRDMITYVLIILEKKENIFLTNVKSQDFQFVLHEGMFCLEIFV